MTRHIVQLVVRHHHASNTALIHYTLERQQMLFQHLSVSMAHKRRAIATSLRRSMRSEMLHNRCNSVAICPASILR